MYSIGINGYFFPLEEKNDLENKSFQDLLAKKLEIFPVSIESVTRGFYIQLFNTLSEYEESFYPSESKRRKLYKSLYKHINRKDFENFHVDYGGNDFGYQYFSSAFDVKLVCEKRFFNVIVATKEDINLYLTEYEKPENYTIPSDTVFVASTWCQRCSYPGSEDGDIMSIFSDPMSVETWIMNHALPKLQRDGLTVPGLETSSRANISKLKKLLET